MIKFEKIKPGMTLYDCRRPTRRSTFINAHKWMVWKVRIIEVYPEKREVLASWNNNPAVVMTERRVTKYRAKQPK